MVPEILTLHKKSSKMPKISEIARSELDRFPSTVAAQAGREQLGPDPMLHS